MPHVCDTCGKCYVQKRNLTRHVAEKHVITKYWKCSEQNCENKFVRRSYYVSHLEKFHKMSKVKARELAIKSSLCVSGTFRSPQSLRPGVEDISDDDSILDLIRELEDLQDETGTTNFVDDLFDDVNVPIEFSKIAVDLNNNIEKLPEISDIELGEEEETRDNYAPEVSDISEDETQSKEEKVKESGESVNKAYLKLCNEDAESKDMSDGNKIEDKNDKGNAEGDVETNSENSVSESDRKVKNESYDENSESEVQLNESLNEVFSEEMSGNENAIQSSNETDYDGDGEEDSDDSAIVISDDEDVTVEDEEGCIDNDDVERAVVPYDLYSVTDVFNITFYRTTYYRDGRPVMSEMNTEQCFYRL